MEATLSIETLAGEAYGWFESKQRGDETIIVRKDDAPEWVETLVYAAHHGFADFLPDDWRYATIRDACGAIHDAGEGADLDDLQGEFADGSVDAYTGARLAWFASNMSRHSYVDEALSEFGERTVNDSSDIVDLIGLGQYMEASEIFGQVRQALADELENRN